MLTLQPERRKVNAYPLLAQAFSTAQAAMQQQMTDFLNAQLDQATEYLLGTLGTAEALLQLPHAALRPLQPQWLSGAALALSELHVDFALAAGGVPMRGQRRVGLPRFVAALSTPE